MPTRYDSRSSIVAISPAGYLQILPGNRNRVALNLSGNGTAFLNFVVEWSTVNGVRGNFLWLDPSDNKQLPYRDWGPLIKEPIFARCALGAMDALAVETFVIPGS